MTFTSLTFLLLFLPAGVLLYRICPPRGRLAVLAGVSLAFYALGDWGSLGLLLASLLFDYLLCALIVRAKGDLGQRRLLLGACVGKNLLLILLFGISLQLSGERMPLGLLVYTTTSLGYVIDVYRGDERFERNPLGFVVLCAFFGKLYAGPIVQYADLRENLGRRPTLEQLGSGLMLFVSGLAKHVILVGGLTKVYSLTSAIPEGQASVLSCWVLILSYTFSLYYSLSGYSDMAQGLARMFGLELPANFLYPFQCRTVSDFFNRFNITVTQYIQRYVYLFLGGDTHGRLSTVVNTLLTTMLMGLWFGIRLNLLVWGVYFACFMLLERLWLLRYLERLPPVVDRCYTFLVSVLSFTIFAGSSLGQTGRYLRWMFGLGGLPAANSQITYILSSNYLAIALSFFFATSLTQMGERLVRSRSPVAADVLSVGCNLGLLLLSVAFML